MSTFDSEAKTSSGNDPVLSTSASEPATVYYSINEPSVIYQTFDQEVVAVHLNTGSYHTLSGLAGEVFLRMGSAGASLREIAAELAAKYDASASTIEKDLERFVAELQQQAMVKTVAAPSTPSATDSVTLDRERAVYTAPALESFSDLEGLVLIDPVHDVGAAGWPNAAPEMLEKGTAEAYALPRMRCRIASQNVIFERFNTETVAMDLGTGAYHSLSGPAEDIFLLFPNEPTTFEIRNALAKKYAVEAGELESSLREYLNQLVQEGLIVLEKLDSLGGEVAERELELSSEASGATYVRPRLETFAQPAFDGSFGEEVTLREEMREPADGADEGSDRSAPMPYAKRRYAVGTGDLLFSTAGGETVIADRDGGKYFKLNEAASDVFAMLPQTPSVGEVVARLKRKYAVREQDLRIAVMVLLWNLRKVGLAKLAVGDAVSQGAPPVPQEAPPKPFSGFDVAAYHDLAELLRPFNTYPAARPKPQIFHVRQFLMLLERYFEEAAAVCGSTEEVFAIAGQSVSIRCAGENSAELRKAFEHLKTSAALGDNSLTISAWSHASSPAGPLLEMMFARLYENWSVLCGPRGELSDFHCDEVSAIYHPGPDVLSILDKERGQAFYILRDDAPLPFWELSSPFRHILHPWFDSRNRQYTHAGAVGGPNGGVLLAGKGGSGKSTTSLLCASAGMMYAADDYCLTETGDAGAQVYSLYNTAKLKGPEDLERLPEMSGRSFNADSFEAGGVGKGTYNLSEFWPERVTGGFPLRAILLPTVTGRVDSRLEPCSPAEALLALVPSTVAQLPLGGQADCQRLAALAETVPAYRLYLGSDLKQIPVLIGELIGESAG